MQGFPDLLATLALLTNITSLTIARTVDPYATQDYPEAPDELPPDLNDLNDLMQRPSGFSGNMILTQDFSEGIKCIKGLQALTLINCEVNAECANALEETFAALQCLGSILLQNCKFTGEGAWQACLQGIGSARNLQQLDVIKQVWVVARRTIKKTTRGSKPRKGFRRQHLNLDPHESTYNYY